MTHALTKLIAPWLVIAGLAGATAAQPAAGSDPAAPAAAAAPAAPAAPAAAPGDAASARAQCTAAMNADPTFAAEIVKIADASAALKRDQETLAAHTDAYAHIQKNERHVIYAYAAMWIIAAGFVIFLWRRQQGLQAEIAQLQRDLEAAASDKPAGGRS
jgi:prophage DNA circulation protein